MIADNLFEDAPVDFTSRIGANSEIDAVLVIMMMLQWAAQLMGTVPQRVT